jgi:DnaJ-domain-containing protein 1
MGIEADYNWDMRHNMTMLDHLKTFEQEVHEKIDEYKHEYVDSDWADDFDDIHEAYDETGRGQAESQAVQELIKNEYPKIRDDDLVKLMDKLAEEFCISYN